MDDQVRRKDDTWNRWFSILQGIAVTCSQHLSSPRLVLPYLYLAFGGPVFFAGLLLPIDHLVRVVTVIAATPRMQRVRQYKWAMGVSLWTKAAALFLLAFTAGAATAEWLVALFLLVTVMIGAGQGTNGLAFNLLMGRILPPEQRNSLIFTQTALAGFVVVAVAWAAGRVTAASSPIEGHLILLWAGALFTLLSGFLILMIREPGAMRSDPGRAKAGQEAERTLGYRDQLRKGLQSVSQVPWFRRFTIARSLLLSIELAMPFFAIHAASHHQHKIASLSAFIIAAGIGSVAGGPLWRGVGRRSVVMTMTLGSLITVLAGAGALILEFNPALRDHHLHAIIFFLAALGAQGALGGRIAYLLQKAGPEARVYYVAASDALAGFLGIFAALLLSSIAHLQGVAWPLVLLVALNLLATFYCSRLPATGET